MRLFIAINFDKNTKDSFSKVQQELKKKSTGSFTDVENLHMTLVFLGEVNEKKLDIIKNQIDALKIKDLELVFNHAGYFQREGGDIWWIGIKHNNELIALQKQLSKNLIKSGFHIDKHFFKPHITIARRVKSHYFIDNNSLFENKFIFVAKSISLMKSEIVNNKQAYTEIYIKDTN